MSQLTYRSAVYRGAYATIFVGLYLLLAAYLLSGDGSGSEDNAGVWLMLLGMAVAFATGALAGPRLHRQLFGYRKPRRRVQKHSKRSSS